MSDTAKTVQEYLQQLRAQLSGADPALIQDALYDAEEYLRSEIAAHPRSSEQEVLSNIANTYGKPEEVAEIYRDTEIKVSKALKPPVRKSSDSIFARFFGVITDSRAYASLFYMLLALATGIFYFTWAVTGLSLSLGMAILIIGIPLFILFMASVWALSLVEGRIVEVLLGERMPRRPVSAQKDLPILSRIGNMLSDSRTWLTLLYMLLMLPLGIAYFTIAVTALAFSLGMFLAPIGVLFGHPPQIALDGFSHEMGFFASFAFSVLGLLSFFVTLHVAKGIGYLHGQIAKHLLVKAAD